MLTVSVRAQLLLFVYSIAVGAALSAFYDFFRVFRKLIPHKRFLPVFVEDLVFCTVSGAVYVVFIFAANLGIPRLYSAFASCCGFALWRLVFGDIFVAAAVICAKTLFGAIRLFIRPLKKILVIFADFARKILYKSTICVSFLKKHFIFAKKRYKIYNTLKNGRIFDFEGGRK